MYTRQKLIEGPKTCILAWNVLVIVKHLFHVCRPAPFQPANIGRPLSKMTVGASSVNLLVVASPDTPELSVLKKLPAGCKTVATGQTLADLSHFSEEQWASIDVVLNCGVGKNAGKRENVQVSRTAAAAAIAAACAASACCCQQFHLIRIALASPQATYHRA